MKVHSSDETERRRLAALRSLNVLDSMGEKEFDDIALLAAEICGSPMALISLVDDDRQWFKARVGFAESETSRDFSFCAHAIVSDETLFEVADASLDSRFSKNPLVTGDPNIRSYAGAVLTADTGEKLGTLCVLDRKPNQLSESQRLALSALANQVTSLLSARRNAIELNQQKEAERFLRLQLEIEKTSFDLVLNVSPIGLAVVREPEFIFERVNEAFKKLVGPREYLNRGWIEVYPEFSDSPILRHLKQIYGDGKRIEQKEMPIVVQNSNGVAEKRYYDISYDRIDRTALNNYYSILIQTVDVTDAVAAKTKLQDDRSKEAAARKSFTNVLESMPVGVAILEGPKHRYTFTNHAHAAFYGGRNDFVGRELLEAVPELASTEVLRALDDVYSKGVEFVAKDLPVTLQQVNRELRDLYCDVSYQPMRDSEGEICGILATVIDVTQRKLSDVQAASANAKTAREKAKFEDVLSQMNVPILLFEGPELRISICNAAMRKLLDIEVDPIGKTPEEVLPEAVEQGFKSLVEKVYRTGQTVSGENTPFTRRYPDGSSRTFYVNFTFAAKRDADNRIEGVLDVTVDVTDAYVAAQTIGESEKRYELASRATQDAIWDWNLVTNDVIWNQTLHTGFGYPVEAQRGDSIWWYEHIHPEDRKRVVDGIHHVIDEGKHSWNDKYRFRKADGSYRTVIDRGYVEHAPDGQPIRMIGAMQDVSEREQIQRELQESRLVAEQANEAKSSFLANMSHEIRTPLGSIMGFADLAKQSDGPKEAIDTYLEVIHRNSVQVLKIVDDILDLAKVEAGKVLIEKVDTNFISFLADFASLMGFRARDNAIQFTLKAETDLPDHLVFDPTRVRQVLTNAVVNAIKFTAQGSVVLHVCYADGTLRFGISDTGRGISTEQAQHLFQAFNQADISTTRRFGGTGLGLVLTKKLCQQMGGDYILERSELGKGSHFLATIAAEPPENVLVLSKNAIAFKADYQRRESAQPLLPLSGVKILVVEDSPDNQELLRIILEKQGARFSLAKDGLEGLQKAMNGDHDLILMDVQMPNLDGHEAVRRMRAQGLTKPVIALTAHAMKEEFDRAMRSGFTAYLTKPVNKMSLIKMIASYAPPVDTAT